MTKVAIIGAGKGGTSLIEIFHNDPLVQIVGVADIDKDAPGIRLAKKLKIPVTKDYKRLLGSKKANLVIDVTGNPSVEDTLHRALPPGMAIIGGPSAKFMWQLIEERIQRKDKIEQHLLEYQSLYRLYVKEVAVAIAEERTRIACDIHDGFVQTLIGLNYHLEYCANQLEKNAQSAIAAIKEVKRLLKGAIGEAREAVFNLRPIDLDRSGLYHTLSDYLKTYEQQYHIKTVLKASGKESSIPSETKTFVFRIIQEALANVQKHAKATEVAITVRTGKHRLDAAIFDNGVGFDPNKIEGLPEKETSFGLKAISERARLLEGSAKIQSTKGKGTQVILQIPLTKQVPH